MVNYLVFPSKIGILILQRIEGMGIAGDDLLYLVAIQDFNIHHGLHLEQHFVPGPAGHISTGGLLRTQSGIRDSQVVQDLGKGHTYLLITVVKSSGTSYP